jgi:hypothetical protein
MEEWGRMMKGVNLIKIYCKHIYKHHNVSPVQVLCTNKKKVGLDERWSDDWILPSNEINVVLKRLQLVLKKASYYTARPLYVLALFCVQPFSFLLFYHVVQSRRPSPENKQIGPHGLVLSASKTMSKINHFCLQVPSQLQIFCYNNRETD